MLHQLVQRYLDVNVTTVTHSDVAITTTFITHGRAHTQQQQTSRSKTNKNGVDFAYAQQYERAINKCEKMKMARLRLFRTIVLLP